MGASHRLNLAKGIKAAAGGRYFVDVEMPTESRLGENNRIRMVDLEYQVITLYHRLNPFKSLASMNAQTLPGCCGVVVFSRFNGREARDVARLIGFGYAGAKSAGYGMAQLTLLRDSAILPLIGATPLLEDEENVFRNAKTNNMIVLVTNNLEQPERAPIRNDTGGE